MDNGNPQPVYVVLGATGGCSSLHPTPRRQKSGG